MTAARIRGRPIGILGRQRQGNGKFPARAGPRCEHGHVADPRAVVEQLVAAINAHDRSLWRPLFAVDCRCVTATSRVLDIDGLEQVFLRNLVGFPDLRVEVERWIVSGDTVVTEEVMAGTHQGPFGGLSPTGREIRIRMVHITRVAGDRIIERVAYQDSAGLLRQMEEALPA